MFFLYFLYKKYPKIFKLLLALGLSTIILLAITLYHLFSNVNIGYYMKIDDTTLKLGIKIRNKSIFPVKIEKVILEIDKYHLGPPHQIKSTADDDTKKTSKFTHVYIKPGSTVYLDLFFTIFEQFDEPFNGNLLIVMEKWKIKVPYEQKIRNGKI